MKTHSAASKPCVALPIPTWCAAVLPRCARTLLAHTFLLCRRACVPLAWLRCRPLQKRTLPKESPPAPPASATQGFTCQLLQWAKRRRLPPSPARLFRITPHSAHDPRRLVARYVPSLSLEALDARGAFVLHLPDVVYTWVGSAAPPEFAAAAAACAQQLVKYERATRDVRAAIAGQEPAKFLDCLSAPLSERAPSGQGWPAAAQAHCAAYDEAFDMYRSGRRSDIARKGGEGAAEVERCAGLEAALPDAAQLCVIPARP